MTSTGNNSFVTQDTEQIEEMIVLRLTKTALTPEIGMMTLSNISAESADWARECKV